jgi:hypothetical protein
MFWTLSAFAFAVAALVFFLLAFGRVLKGRIGAAVGLGILALVFSGVASALAVYVD